MDAFSTTGRLSPYALRLRMGIVAVFGLLALVFLIVVPPLAQDQAYHNFADQRELLGVPHALNVLSNAPFVVFGLMGLFYILRPSVWHSPTVFPQAWQRWAYLLLFAFVVLTGFGSAYYHYRPNTDTLFWDRLPMAVTFMTFFTLILADRLSPRTAPWLWLPLVAVGVLATTYWHLTELKGVGDMRLYVLVQFLPLLMMPVLLLAFPARQLRTADVFAILGWYALAKLLEQLDKFVYTAGGVVSGHTLKHVVASLGALWILLMLTRLARTEQPKIVSKGASHATAVS
jgi:hypothetical protein